MMTPSHNEDTLQLLSDVEGRLKAQAIFVCTFARELHRGNDIPSFVFEHESYSDALLHVISSALIEFESDKTFSPDALAISRL